MKLINTETDKQLLSALMRTHLANQRTFLAYLRTMLSFILAGLVLIHYFQHPHDLYIKVGIMVIVAGCLIGLWGIIKTIHLSKRIDSLD
jgi:putative membrane protein